MIKTTEKHTLVATEGKQLCRQPNLHGGNLPDERLFTHRVAIPVDKLTAASTMS